MTTINIKLKPWLTPNFVVGEAPPHSQQEGFNPDAAPKWALKDVDAKILAKMCDDFRAEIFLKAEKSDPELPTGYCEWKRLGDKFDKG